MLVVVLLIAVSLFDSALDLEAEGTIGLLAASRKWTDKALDDGTFAELIWATNQFRPGQLQLWEILSGELPEERLTTAGFSATAKNIISFAIIVVIGMAAVGVAMLYRVWEAIS